MSTIKKQIRKDLKHKLNSNIHNRLNERGVKGVYDCRIITDDAVEPIANDIDSLMESGRILKDGGACKVALVEAAGRKMVVKRYNWRGWLKGLRYQVKGSRARRVWFYGHLLPAIGIPTPQPFAWLERSEKGIVRKSYIINEYIEAPTLFDFLCDSTKPHEERADVLEDLHGMFKTMHRHRLTHGDMKRSNILVADGRILLIDLDATTLHRSRLVYEIKRKRDLARFWECIEDNNVPVSLLQKCEDICKDQFS